jgi:hypothetical protein
VVQVIHRDTGDCQAWCFIGDDHNVERIADILSSKYLGAAAMELREMARTPPPPSPACSTGSHRSSSPAASSACSAKGKIMHPPNPRRHRYSKRSSVRAGRRITP